MAIITPITNATGSVINAGTGILNEVEFIVDKGSGLIIGYYDQTQEQRVKSGNSEMRIETEEAEDQHFENRVVRMIKIGERFPALKKALEVKATELVEAYYQVKAEKKETESK